MIHLLYKKKRRKITKNFANYQIYHHIAPFRGECIHRVTNRRVMG